MPISGSGCEIEREGECQGAGAFMVAENIWGRLVIYVNQEASASHLGQLRVQ